MYFRLKEDYALRAWKYVNGALYHKKSASPLKVDAHTFELLRLCDGEHDLEGDEALLFLEEQGVIETCKRGDVPDEWSRYRCYGHRFVPAMNLMLTGRCNYNCRHCFNAADNAAIMTEWDFNELMDLLDQAADCGMHAITLTGGEPMMHPRFIEVVREIYRRNMVLENLTTNGYFLDSKTLDVFDELGCSPQIKISFDGVGHHDWMRNHVGAEADSLRALRLCSQRGFRTMAQVQVWKRNLSALNETLAVLEDAGVSVTRFIRTTESVRWRENVAQSTLAAEEYFDRMLDLAERYMSGNHTMEVMMWRYLMLDPQRGAYSMILVPHPDGRYCPTAPVCLSNRRMMAVGSDGEVMPCLQMGGFLTYHGYSFDSLKRRSLAQILKGGPWHDTVCMNQHQLHQRCAECNDCEWFKTCGGGCRALGTLHAEETNGRLDFCAADPLACLFFKGGWYHKVQSRLKAFRLR